MVFVLDHEVIDALEIVRSSHLILKPFVMAEFVVGSLEGVLNLL